MSGMSGRAFLHVGSPKTGTTFLQAVIWGGRAELGKVGVRVPGPSRHKHFQAALDVRGTPQRARYPERTEGAWDRLLDAGRDWSGDLLISNELLAAAPPDRARAAVSDLVELGYEPHVIVTARDLARQLPAEWQERIKHRSTIAFGTFLARARDPESRVFRTLWAAQDYADIVQRWGGALPREQVHVITVPPPGAPRALLWERFAAVLGVDAARFSLDVPRENTSLGLEQTILLQRVNRRLGERVAFPGPYTDVGLFLFAHQVLGPRSGTPLVLGGDDLAFARDRSAEIVESLRAQRVTVHGDLAELLVPDDREWPATSSAREAVADDILLAESLDAMADLLAAFTERVEANREQRTRLREDLQKARADLTQARRQVAELGVRSVPLRAEAVRRVKSHARAAADRVKQARRPRRPRVCFLVFSADGSGGVARTTLTVANALAGRYDVEVLSVYRSRGEPTFELDPRVNLTYLVHAKPGNRAKSPHLRELASQPSALPDPRGYTAASDAVLRAAFAELRDDDVLISTRPSLHPSSLVLAPEKRLIRIGWDHLNFPTRYAGQGLSGQAIDSAIPGLDAFVVLTEADAADYRRRHPDARLEVIRNAVPWAPATLRPPHDQTVVMAAGRLSEVKGYERLIEAWALIQEEFPDWTCRIYGKGPLEGALREQVEATGAAVELPGYTTDVRAELGRSAVFAMSSRVEGFPMTLIEALAEGTPLVSFDCPRGPGEIIVDGHNGLLVPDGDVPGLAKALATLMRDKELRDRMGEQALVDARQYEIGSIADKWVTLIEQLHQERRG